MEKPNHYSVLPRWSFSAQKAIAHIYFFFNSIGLKGGLLYTNLLTPFFLIWIIKKKYLHVLIKITALLLPFAFIQYCYGVDLKSLVISNALMVSTITFMLCAYIYFKEYKGIDKLFQQILIVNFILVIIALPFYFLPYSFQKWFWYTNVFTAQNNFTRLALFTFEASYYSMLLIPIVYYFALKLILNLQIVKGKWIWLMLALPMLLSMSFGVIGGTLITAGLMLLLHYQSILKYKTPVLILSIIVVSIFLSALIALLFFPDTLLVKRVFNIFTGADTSTNGRTKESFLIAWEILKIKSKLWGCGLGQSKFLLPEIISKHFPHWGQLSIYRIPNAVAETIAVFGIMGVLLRFGIIFYLFKKTKVYQNYFRLSLFIFVFIYQFTGSFITNIVEYIIWLLAFVNVFPEFDKHKT